MIDVIYVGKEVKIIKSSEPWFIDKVGVIQDFWPDGTVMVGVLGTTIYTDQENIAEVTNDQT